MKQLSTFLDKSKTGLSKQVRQASLEEFKVTILQPEQVSQAACTIREGGLVAFPTETVYGLGANAFNERALLRIYEVKKRPLTDPIIVHVTNLEKGLELVEPTPAEEHMYRLLATKFWPGPLTLILKANLNKLPLVVTAQTGFVGIRVPKHSYARKLIQEAGVPIGAPSANLFSHVSPTQPVHVLNDFFKQSISIVDGDRCGFGVESTVVKIKGDCLEILREGSLSVDRIKSYLKESLPEANRPAIFVTQKIVKKDVKMEAPGQLLKHYAPYLPCFHTNVALHPQLLYTGQGLDPCRLDNMAFISFSDEIFGLLKEGTQFFFEAGSCLPPVDSYQPEYDMFCDQVQRKQMRELYYLLRKCQQLPVKCIVVGWAQQRQGTLWDKILRATQNRMLSVTENNKLKVESQM